MKHLDLCSGIGGFALAARWAGWETVQFVEIDKFCQKVLKKHWPEVSIHDDLRTFNATGLMGRIDILTAGYPCQPFSTAGKQKGTEDPRHLWPEVFRVIRECRPRWVVCENVGGHVRLGLDDVLSDLESEGYSARATIIPACSVNAPHRRDRVWIIAHDLHAGTRVGESYASGQERERAELMERALVRPGHGTTIAEGNNADSAAASDAGSQRAERISSMEQDEERASFYGAELGGIRPDASYAKGQRCRKTREYQPLRSEERATCGSQATSDSEYGGREGRDEEGKRAGAVMPPELLGHPSSEGLPDWAGGEMGQPGPITEFERSDGAGKAREIERYFCRVDDGVSVRLDGFTRPVRNRVSRLKSLGNAIVPQVAYEIFKAINAANLL